MGDDHWTRKRPEARPWGEKNGQSKLTADAVRTIREGYSAGETKRDLAQRFGVHPAHIHNIVTRKRWKHIA